MKRAVAILVLFVCVVAGTSYLSSKHHIRAAGQAYSAPCLSYIPSDWGQYLGSSSYGVAFEDTAGTIRFVKNPPCDISSTPSPDLEIHRKR
jgi:hypothetical protein